MPFTSTLIAVVVLVAGGPVGAGAEPARTRLEVQRSESIQAAKGPLVSYEVRLVSLNSCDWRGKFDPRLEPVAHMGGATVWAVDALTLRDLLTYWAESTTTNISQAPKMLAHAGENVTLVDGEEIMYVAHLRRNADGPPGQATRLAFIPKVEKLRNGLLLDLAGSKVTPEGLRIRLDADLQRVVGFDTVVYHEELRANPARPASESGHLSAAVGRLVHGDQKSALNGTIQVPTVDSSRVNGEWVVPKDGSLIVGFNARAARASRGPLKEMPLSLVLVISYHLVPGESPASATAAPVTAARPGKARGPAAN